MENNNSPKSGETPVMSACIVGHVTVKDAGKWAEYCSKVPATIIPWGGRLVLRGQTNTVMTGVHTHTGVVIIQFPDAKAVAGWNNSPAYQALIPIREQAVDLILVSYDC